MSWDTQSSGWPFACMMGRKAPSAPRPLDLPYDRSKGQLETHRARKDGARSSFEPKRAPAPRGRALGYSRRGGKGKVGRALKPNAVGRVFSISGKSATTPHRPREIGEVDCAVCNLRLRFARPRPIVRRAVIGAGESDRRRRVVSAQGTELTTPARSN